MFLPRLINKFKLNTGIEVGVAYGGHSDSILNNTKIDCLYGIDPYKHFSNYIDPMNFKQEKFDELYKFTLNRLSKYGPRFKLIRKTSVDASKQFKSKKLDFAYIDAVHSYEGVMSDLITWFPLIKEGGLISGHDYGHVNFPGVKTAIDEYFQRFGWKINVEQDGFWWLIKNKINISFIIPAYNSGKYIKQAVSSIIESNFQEGDEIVICNDGSTDNTKDIILNLSKNYKEIIYIEHKVNKGGGAARNTAIESTKNNLIFCLDSDNVLSKRSVYKLKKQLFSGNFDVVCFNEVRYFKTNTETVTHKWIYENKNYTIVDYLNTYKVPGASGNYLFTKRSWIKAGRYPEYAGALDTWGFGFYQAANGCRLSVTPGTYYFHRYGYDSYWVKDTKARNKSIRVLQLILPYIDYFDTNSVYNILKESNRKIWFDQIGKRKIGLRKNDNFINRIKRKLISIKHLYA